jgi:hypothetical protein
MRAELQAFVKKRNCAHDEVAQTFLREAEAVVAEKKRNDRYSFTEGQLQRWYRTLT